MAKKPTTAPPAGVPKTVEPPPGKGATAKTATASPPPGVPKTVQPPPGKGASSGSKRPTTALSVPNAPYNLHGYGVHGNVGEGIYLYWSQTTPPSIDTNWIYKWNGSTWAYLSPDMGTFFDEFGLDANTTYYYFVCAHNSAGTTCASTYAAITTLGGAVPNAPTGLGGYTLSVSSVKFTWSETTPPYVNVYWIYKWNGSVWAYYDSTTHTYYNDYGLSANTTYYYFVCADNSAGYTCASTYVGIYA